MATVESLTGAIDQVVRYFNARKLDLPDGLFDRRTQFVINGAPFETLLGSAPNDPLTLMLARGPAGYRFTVMALQHALPDARLHRPSAQLDPAAQDAISLTTSGAPVFAFRLALTGTLRGSGEAIDSLVSVTLRLASDGHVEIAEAIVDAGDVEKIRQARLRP